jgi:uncharacterized MAPEG superfamily protein
VLKSALSEQYRTSNLVPSKKEGPMNVLIAPLGASVLVAVSALVQHFNTAFSKGPSFVLGDRSAPLSREGFAGRAARTLQNNLESTAMVGPTALVIAITGGESKISGLAALVYLGARVGFTLFYWLGVSPLRTLSWVIGMGAIAALIWVAIGTQLGAASLLLGGSS